MGLGVWLALIVLLVRSNRFNFFDESNQIIKLDFLILM